MPKSDLDRDSRSPRREDNASIADEILMAGTLTGADCQDQRWGSYVRAVSGIDWT
ncbi:MAG: hypothetical protein ACI91Z_001259, partial [Yoonia sp.]